MSRLRLVHTFTDTCGGSQAEREVRGGPQPSPRSPPAHLALASGWGWGTGQGSVLLGSTALASAARWPGPGREATVKGSQSPRWDLRAAAVCQEPAPLLLGGPEETGDQLGPGRPAASERTVHRVRGPGSKGTTSRDLPPQPGLGARGRTQTGCWRRLLGSETGRAGSAPPPPPALSQDLGLGGGKLGLVFSRQNRKWYSFRRHLQEDAGVQPRWIQGIRRVDGVGVERLVYLLI